ncbi:hypothetical protein NOC27_905 [Nitrosococcus oceani AFC27]|uniref:Transposase IS4-like domain-containing protein n=1 Tax=Nitrosococcus oceani C-27 TaxID=314279 RepID=A0A0E2ZLK5_9GAMM|nr:hypothetical protein NOC27_905 [Nitrosococcus oceani AFC27]KFI19187.1 hypothetical protein IB75_10230 [Nitrosococcus oceani C-27]GEM18772.1 hypothetical protein NONS58_01330 [Nitrosococcus oceani]
MVLWGESPYWRRQSKSKLIHSVAVTPANVHDSQTLEDLLHGNETRVRGDSVYAEQKETLNEIES